MRRFSDFFFFFEDLLLDTLETTFRACLILLCTADKEMLVMFFSRKQITSEKVTEVPNCRKIIES